VIHTCLACTITSHDVAMTLIDLEDKQSPDYVPTAEQRVVSVPLVSAETNRGITGFDYSEVRERYINEPRCRDKKACAARVKALQPAPPPPADAREEGPSWLL
jgi:hypothetical protein